MPDDDQNPQPPHFDHPPEKLVNPAKVILTLTIAAPCGCHLDLAAMGEHDFFTDPSWCGCHVLLPDQMADVVGRLGSGVVESYALMMAGLKTMPKCEKHPDFQCPGLNRAPKYPTHEGPSTPQ